MDGHSTALTQKQREITYQDAPEEVLLQLDAVFEALNQSALLVSSNRAWGIRIGLSQNAREALRARHGDAAEFVLQNCPVIE